MKSGKARSDAMGNTSPLRTRVAGPENGVKNDGATQNSTRPELWVELIQGDTALRSNEHPQELKANRFVTHVDGNMSHKALIPQFSNTARNLFRAGMKLLFSCFRIQEDLVLFEGNRAYDDNSRALFEYCIKQKSNERFRFVWFVDNPEQYSFLKDIDNVDVRRYIDGEKYTVRDLCDAVSFYYLNCVSKRCIYSNAPLGTRKRPGQINYYLMHGVALKNTVGFFGKASDHDFICATSKKSAEWLRVAIPGSADLIHVTGYPRNDYLFQKHAHKLCETFLPGSGSMKKILWMPTFKHASNSGRNDLSEERSKDLSLLTKEFMEKLNTKLIENNMCIFVKFHPFQNLDFVDFVELSNVVCLSKSGLQKSDVYLYSFIGEFDALITDYSSVAFDYMLLDRPIGYDLTDYEEYKNGIGFIVDNPLEYMPGHKIYSQSDFIDYIDQVARGEDRHQKARRDLCGVMNDFTDNQSCERVFKMLAL